MEAGAAILQNLEGFAKATRECTYRLPVIRFGIDIRGFLS